MDPLFAELPEDLSALSDDELVSFIAEQQEISDRIGANPDEFLSEERPFEALKTEMTDGVARIAAAKAELKARAAVDETVETEEAVEEASAEKEELAALAALAHEEPEGDDDAEEGDEEEEPEAEAAVETETAAVEETEPEVVETVVAAAAVPAKRQSAPAPVRTRHARPARAATAKPPVADESRVVLTAAAEGLGLGLGAEIPDELTIAEMMIKRRGQFGQVPEGTHGDRIPIARADWSHLYGDDRILSATDSGSNMTKVADVTSPDAIRVEFEKRRQLEGAEALTASGGLCAPRTPYYQLQMLSTASRPVRAALPAFNADRGGIIAGRPASLGDITTAVGTKTAAQDAAGGSSALKTCQVIDCPDFEQTDVEIIWHCLQFGNLGGRSFPELVAQGTCLTMAAFARAAETLLLDGIDSASTQVTASDLGLGASAVLPQQIGVAAQGMRSRHRMDPNAVLRVLLPYWVLDMLVDDVQRGQFQRWDTVAADFIRVLRADNVEPSFYMDSASGKSQVFGAQTASDLLPFPSTVTWYLYPEGSFLYLDGGTLELGLVRDSVLNSTNDYQIFGEGFENVAFVGIESLAVTSTVCDSGTVSLPESVTCPIDYSDGNYGRLRRAT